MFVTLAITTLCAGVVTEEATAVNADHGESLVSAKPAAFTPHVMDGSVNAVVQVGSLVVAAGTFTSVSPVGTYDDLRDDLVRNGIFAFDATSGQIDPHFDPVLTGPANSLDTDGTSVYLAGSFTAVDGDTARKRIVKLSADGVVDRRFKAQPNKAVSEVVVRGSRVYIGGTFTSVKNGTVGHSRMAMAALDATTGSVLPGLNLPFTGVYDPNNSLNGKMGGVTHIKRFDVTADGQSIAAVGNFAKVGGQTRAQLALISTNVDTNGVATVTPWFTNRYDRAHNACAKVFDTFMKDVDFSPDGSYFVVTTTGAYAGGAGSGTLCDTTSRWETQSTANDPTWINYTGGDTTYGVAVTGSVIYTGGHFRWQNNPFQGDQAGPGAVARSGIAALDPANGLPFSWNPGRTRGVGAQALYATPTGLWVGSDTTKFKHQTRGRIAFVPLNTGTTIPDVAPAVLPNALYLAQTSQGSVPGVLHRRSVDASGAPMGAPTTANAAVDWGRVRGAFMVNGTLYYGASDGGFYARTFDPATGSVGAQRVVNLHDDPDDGQRIPFTVPNLTGMFYDAAQHRIYYTLGADNRLYYRYFTPESEVVGAQTFQASTNVAFGAVAGMTLAGGRILYGSGQDGALRSVAFSSGRVTGTPAVVSNDGTWKYRAIFVPNG